MEIISGLGEEAATLGERRDKESQKEKEDFFVASFPEKRFLLAGGCRDVIKTFALMRHRISRAWAGAGLARGSLEFICSGIS